jgi:hypothetical protein
MKRVLPIGLVSTVVVTALVSVSGTALAYFSTTGAGEGSATVTKLLAPTITSATAGVGGTVTLSWSTVPAPGTGTVTYFVSRDGGNPAGDCPSATTATGATTCTDSGLTVGTHTYEVTARWHSWSSTSSPVTAKVTVGTVARFVLSAASTTPTAGVADNLTITAKDESGSTVSNYTGSHSLIFSGAPASPGGTVPTVVNSAGAAVAFGSATAIEFNSGVATVASSKNGVMKLYKAGATSVGVSEGSVSAQAALSLTVSPSTASKLVLGAASSTPAAGASDALTVTAQDTYGNTATSYTGSHSLTYSGASASPGGNVPTVSNSSGADIAFGSATATTFSAGVATASGAANGAMKLYKSGATSVKVGDGSLTSAANTITVSPASASKLALSAASTTPTAGVADNLTLTASDPYGNTATSYTGSHSLTFSGASASPSGAVPTVANSAGTAVAFGAATALTFSSGVATVSGSSNGVMKLSRAETASISASDGSLPSTVPVAVAVSPATAARLALTQVTISAGTLSSPCLFTCTVTALGNSGTVKAKIAVTDSLGNTVTALGTGHAVKVTTNGSGTISGTPLAISSSGAAESTTQFTFTGKSSGPYTETVTAATSEGTVYTSATLTASK